MTDKIYNIPAGCAFAEVLAGHFLREYHGRELELTDVLFLLPNRRAVKALKGRFCAFAGVGADTAAADAAYWRRGRRRAVSDRI